MLTNAMETQMVRSLGVQIGGAGGPAEPMHLVRTFLSDAAPSGDAPAATEAAAPPRTSGSRCPFAGEAAAATTGAAALTWTREAEERIARIPDMARPMVRMGVEMHAREHGMTTIDDSVIDAVKARFGM
jgi:hypothetical protein